MAASELNSPSSETVPLFNLIRSAQSGFASGERVADGVVQIRMNNVTTDGNLDWSSYIRVPASQKQVEKYHLRTGDVLFNNTNSPELVGKSTTFQGYKGPVVFSNHFIRLRVDETKLDAQYLARWLTKQWQLRTFERFCTRWVNQATMRKEDLLALEIPLPPLTEQKRIAAILSQADRLRRLRRYARELSDGYLGSVFLEMFGDPVSNPMAWKAVRLSEQIRLVGGYAFRSGDFVERGIPLVRIGTVNTGFFDASTLAYLPNHFAREYSRFLLYPGELVITLTGTVGKDDYANVCMLENHFPRYFLNQRVAKIDLDVGEFTPEYVLYAFKHRAVKRILTNPSRGIRQANISNEDILGLHLALPPFPLQKNFTQIVRRFERLRAQQREAERQAEHLFGSLLHRAFQGGL